VHEMSDFDDAKYGDTRQRAEAIGEKVKSQTR